MFTTSFELIVYVIITGGWRAGPSEMGIHGPTNQVQKCCLTGRQIQGEQGLGCGRKVLSYMSPLGLEHMLRLQSISTGFL